MRRSFRLLLKMIVILFLLGVVVHYVINRNEIADIQRVVQVYDQNMQSQNFVDILSHDGTKNMTLEETAQKYFQIFNAMGAKDIHLKNLQLDRVQNHYQFSYQLAMKSKIGKIRFNRVTGEIWKLHGKWKILNSEKMIIPNVTVKHTILQVKINYATRGEIRSVAGNVLAKDVVHKMVGIAPEKLNDSPNKEENIHKIASQFNLSENALRTRLNQFILVNEDSFLPLKAADKIKQPEVPGLVDRYVTDRQHGQNRKIGTVGMVSDGEINADPTLNEHDRVGRTGWERKYNSKLQGKDGGKFVFTSLNKKIVLSIQNKAKSGQVVKLR